jgi:predicted P-loop ATPase/GTPase
MEAKAILVAGLLERDSGKTWTVLALAKSLSALGLRVAPFKPVAGFNLWYSYEAVRYSLERGFLVSNDLLSYIRHVGLNDFEAVLANPYSLGLMYPDPQRVGGVARYLAAVEDVEKSIVISRATVCDGERVSVSHAFFPQNMRVLASSACKIVGELASRLGAVEDEPRSFVERVSGSSMNILNCLKSLVERRSPHALIIESFNNAVQPFKGALDLASLYLVVTPSKLLVYDGVKVREAVAVVGEYFTGTVDKIYSLLTPLASYDIPLVESPDKLAEYYRENIVDNLLKIMGLE